MKSIPTQRFFLATFLAAFLFLSISCDTNDRFRTDYSTVPAPLSITNPISVDTTDSGLIIYVLEEGSGEIEVTPRDQVNFYYTKRYRDDLSDVITSTYVNGSTSPSIDYVKFITSSIGRRNPSIITEAQFQEGVLGMKEGEKRVLILDPPIISGQGGTYTYSDEEIWIEVEVEEIVF
jgi:hypothetical protein|tara:strand:- start:197 stop:727 length:531 start_codon:yes stop_codon:yes gene_type:complete